MVRSPTIDKNGMKKGAWSEDEDNKLKAYIMRYGHWNWRELPKYAGLSRCGKSCRLRWYNYLQPNVKRGDYTKEEEDIILNLHNQIGKKWSVIAKQLPGRTDNEIKNYWHTHLKKRAIVQNQASTKEVVESSLTCKSEGENPCNSSSQTSQIFEDITTNQEKENESLFIDLPISDDHHRNNTVEALTPSAGASSSSSCSELSLSFSCDAPLSDLMNWVGEDHSTIDTSFGSLEDFWSQQFETDYYEMSAPLMDLGLIYPPSPMNEEVFLWSYDN